MRCPVVATERAETATDDVRRALLNRASESVTTTHQARLTRHWQGPIIIRGEGQYVDDRDGKRNLDGLSRQFGSGTRHGGQELAEAALAQLAQLEYFLPWNFAHTPSHRTCRTARDARTRRDEPRLLHIRRQ